MKEFAARAAEAADRHRECRPVKARQLVVRGVVRAVVTSAAFAQNKYFGDWPAGTDPREVGKRVAERFIPTPHMEMTSHGPQALHYCARRHLDRRAAVRAA